MGKERSLRVIDAATVRVVESTALYSPPPVGGSASGNADTVDGYHAAAVPVANYLLALNGSAQFVASVIPTHAILSKHSVTGSAYQVVGLTAANTLGLLTPATTVGANTIPLGGAGGAITWSGAQTFNGGITVNTAVATFNAGATIAAGQTLTTPAVTATANLLINPTGDVLFDPTGNDILPSSNYDLNLGSLSKKYLTLHAAELWVETLVAQNTIATIGGRILVGPTTSLTRDLAAGGTTIYVKHNEMASGDRAYLEANGSVEFLAITSGPTLEAEGDYSYTVTRNLDGSGANTWYAGDAMFNTGTTGDGFIDLYSLRSVKSATQYGPTIVGNVRNSATYNDWTEHWAIGNLNGIYGYGVTTYGVALGKYANGASFITVDATNGIRIQKRAAGADTVVGQWDASGNMTLGTVATDSGNAYWDATAKQLKFRGSTNGTVVQAYIDTDGSMTAGGGNVILDSGGITLTEYAATQSGRVTLWFGPRTWTNQDKLGGIYLYDAGAGSTGYLSFRGQQQDNVDGGLADGSCQLRLYTHGTTAMEVYQTASGAVASLKLQLNSSGDLFNRGYLYPGTGSATQATRYLYDDGSRTKASGGLAVGTDVVAQAAMLGSSTATRKQLYGLELQYSDAANYGFVSAGQLYLAANAYYDGSWKYRSSSTATLIQNDGTDIVFFRAATGTVDNAVSFTEIMRMYASGGIYIGPSPSDPGAGKLTVVNQVTSDVVYANNRLRMPTAQTGSPVGGDMWYDETNNKLWIYDGADVGWKSVVLS